MGVGIDGVFLGLSPADAGCRVEVPDVPQACAWGYPLLPADAGLFAPSLRDSRNHLDSAFPTLKRGANQHCAYGARCGAPVRFWFVLSHPSEAGMGHPGLVVS